MKSTQKWIVFFVVLAVAMAWYLLRLKKNTKNVRVRIGKITIKEELPAIQDLNKLKEIAKLRDIDIDLNFEIDNFSNQDFTINQIFAQIYKANQNELIAGQLQPLSQKIKVRKNQTQSVTLPFRVNMATLLEALFFEQGNLWQNVFNLFTAGTGFTKLNKSVRLKGFLRIQGNLFKVQFDEVVRI